MPSVNALPEPPPLPTEPRDAGAADPTQWRFSLRSMMIATSGIAILCGFASALPYAFSQALIGLIWIAASGWLATGLLFAHGDQRAFCIGAAIVVSSTWTQIGGRFLQGMSEITRLFLPDSQFSRAFASWLDLMTIASVAVLNGWFCIRARRYFEQQADD